MLLSLSYQKKVMNFSLNMLSARMPPPFPHCIPVNPPDFAGRLPISGPDSRTPGQGRKSPDIKSFFLFFSLNILKLLSCSTGALQLCASLVHCSACIAFCAECAQPCVAACACIALIYSQKKL